MKIPFLTLGVLGATLAVAGVGLEYTLPARETLYTGYSAAAVATLEGKRQPMVRRYQRSCAEVGQAAMVDEILELKPSEEGPARTLAYRSAGMGALRGTTRETGISGWAGLFTPPEKPPASDTPPGDYSDCDLVTDPNKTMVFPSALFTTALPTVTPASDQSISWEARARSVEEATGLERLYEASRAELKVRGPAWRESAVYNVANTGVPTLQQASVRYRHIDGSQVTLEFERVDGDPNITASLVAHRRIPTEPVDKEKGAEESAPDSADTP